MKLRSRSRATAGRPPAQRLLAAALAASLTLGALPPLAQAQGPARATRTAAPVTLNFVNADIEAVSRAMAAILNRQILVDPRVKGTMTLYSEQPLSQREAYLNYLAVLRGLGFTVIEVSDLLKVVPEADAKLQTGAVSVGTVTRTGDQILTQIFRLQHENANNLVQVLRPLISPNNTINANPGNNTLVITDYADNLKRLGKIIASMDVPSNTEIDVIPLEHAVAADLVPLLQRFADSSAVAGAPGAAAGGALTISADSRNNALLVRAPNAARLATIREVINRLDRAPSGNGAAGNIYVVYLKNADAVRLAAVLRAAYSAGSSNSQGGGASGGGLASAAQTQNLAAGAAGAGGAAGGASVQATAPVQASASPSTGGFIQADPATNSLIITAPDPVYRQLRAVIEQLDTRRAQVYVESMIVKMDATEAAEFGFQWQTLLGKSGDKYGVALGTNFSSTSGSGSNIVDLSLNAASGKATIGTGMNVGLIRAINGVYTLGALARFLETNTKANVLSTPNLVALDNEEAKIVIGQNVPFVTGSFTNTGATSGTSTVNPFQTIERKDVGLTLRVKPQVGESGTVRMSIYQENSSVVQNTTSSSNGPTTDKSAIETTVVVDDGQIMVLGGLLKDEFADGEDRVPGLASIPLIGNLFRSEARKRVKTNLLVFLRPVVMRTQAQADALTLDRYDQIRARQIDSQPRPSSVLGINEAPVLPDRKPAAPDGAASAPASGWGKPIDPPAAR